MAEKDPTNMPPKFGYPGPEEFQVIGERLVATVKELIHEGNVRRIVIKRDGRVILAFPLNIGVVTATLSPWLAATAVIGALTTQCSIEVVRADVPPPKGPQW